VKLTKGSSIIKIKGMDGKITKVTNFSREQWVEISDMHTRDAWAIEPIKLVDIKGDVQAAADVLRSRRYVKKRKASEQKANQLVKKARGSRYQDQVAVSDDDFWFVCSFLHMPILT
jgi:hypothetical protein